MLKCQMYLKGAEYNFVKLAGAIVDNNWDCPGVKATNTNYHHSSAIHKDYTKKGEKRVFL